MSMNLHCDELPLPQIGTWASELILSAGESKNPDGGWQGVRRRLLLYWKMLEQNEHYVTHGPYLKRQLIEHYQGLREPFEKAKGPLHFSIR